MDHRDTLAHYYVARAIDSDFAAETNIVMCEKLRDRWDRASRAFNASPLCHSRDGDQWCVMTGLRGPLDVARGL